MSNITKKLWNDYSIYEKNNEMIIIYMRINV